VRPSMSEQKQDDRWRELADLLGVPGDAKEPAPAAQPKPPPPEPEIDEYPEQSVARLEEVPESEAYEESDDPTIQIQHDAPADEWETDFPEDENDTQVEEHEPPTSPDFSQETPRGPEPAPGQEEEPKRGRRRRRRGRRRGGERGERGEG